MPEYNLNYLAAADLSSKSQNVNTPQVIDISVVIPVYNEYPNIDLLYQKLKQSLDSIPHSYELIFVDDGSNDKSFEKLSQLAQSDSRVVALQFVRNFGQTAALSCGIDFAKGEIIIPMDADLQNDPADIKMLIDKLNEGYDVVSGWRKQRQDELYTRLIPSWCANKIISSIIDKRPAEPKI